ncbi:MAG: PilZ domain-containing protein [Terriglobia bacterium]
MESGGKRVSERVELEIPIEVIGTDCMGSQFFDRGHTLVIGRHGGKIVIDRMLAPHQEVTLRCLATNRETEARIVGQIGKGGGTYQYGIEFLGEEDNFWGVEFPPAAESDEVVGRVLMDCMSCKSRELVYLNLFELEVLETNGQLSRACKRCRDVSLWQKSQEQTPASTAPDVPSSDPPQLQNKRREPRREMRVMACIRTARFGQDLVKTRDVSRGGLCFSSPWDYVPGETIEVAVPYSKGGGNIFLPAKIVRLQYLAAEATRIYGVEYHKS